MNTGREWQKMKKRGKEESNKEQALEKERDGSKKQKKFSILKRDYYSASSDPETPPPFSSSLALFNDEKPTPLWEAIENEDIFSKIALFLNDTDKKFLMSANRKCREVVLKNETTPSSKKRNDQKESGVVSPLSKTKLKLSELSSISTLRLCLEESTCVEEHGEEYFMGKIAEMNDMRFVRWAREERGLKWDKWFSSAAAELGNLDMLRYCFEHKCPIDEYTVAFTAHNGHIECLKFLREEAEVEWSEKTACAAAEAGHLNILKYCASRNCKMTADVMAFAAFGGSLECVEFLHKIGVPWSREVCIYAAQSGSCNTLKRLYELGCPLNEDACSEAALHGYLEVLKFLRNDLNCPWDSLTPALASLGGNKEVLEWCFENNCPVCAHSPVNAARNGHCECLKILYEHNAPLNGHILRVARMYKQHECLKFALKNNFPEDDGLSEE